MRREHDLEPGVRDLRPSQLSSFTGGEEAARRRYLADWERRMGVALRTLGDQDQRMADRLAPARRSL